MPLITKIEPDVEDLFSSVAYFSVTNHTRQLLLSMADEFIDWVTNFTCRLANHREETTTSWFIIHY